VSRAACGKIRNLRPSPAHARIRTGLVYRRDHPLRPIRTMVDEVLKQLSPQFHQMYAQVGRPSIPPEQLLRAQLLQMLYSGAQRAAVDGRDGLQHFVSLVCGTEFG
jgi:hypothetical protein